MELGDSTTAERHQRSVVDKALDTFDTALTDLISTLETSGLDHLHADQQVAVWLCRYHHTHFLQKGWSCRINTDRPPGMDPTPLDRPRSTTPHQHPHPTAACTTAT
jgi:hypothetical protein